MKINKSWRVYTLPEVRRLIKDGFVRKGIPVDEELAGPEGMSFTLVADEEYTDEQILRCVSWLYNQRDVVGAPTIADMEKCPNCGAET